MKKHRYLVIAVSILGISVLVTAIYFFFIIGLGRSLATSTSNQEYESHTTHTYTLSDGSRIVVNNWDCGATCNYHTTVSIGHIQKNGSVKKQTIFSCDGITDVTLSHVTDTVATIETMEGDTSMCTYKAGDTITY